MSVRYQIRTPTVIHEVFDDEVVIVNLDSGDYYSLSDAGAACWNCLLSGYSVDETVEAVLSQYQGDASEIRTSVVDLIEDLCKETLIVERTDGRAPESAVDEVEGTDSKPKKTPFVTPSLNRYSDMRDLLLIDPIHEVDESGWPEARQDPAGSSSKE